MQRLLIKKNLPATLSAPSLHGFASFLTVLLPLVFLLGRGGSDAVASSIAALFLLRCAMEREFSWLKQKWLQAAGLLWVYICIRSYWTEYPAESFARSVSWIRYPLFAAALGCWVLKDKEVRQWLLYSLGVSVAFIVFDSLLQFYTGHDLFSKPYDMNEERVRLTGPFGAPVVGVMLVTLMYPVCMWGLIGSEGQPRTKKGFACGSLLCLLPLATVLLSGERTALILCLIGFTLMFLLIPIRRLYKAALMATAAMVLGILLYTNPLVMQRQIHSMGTVIAEFGTSTYGEIWGSAVNMFKMNPAFGVGVMQFRNECPKSEYGPADNLADRCNFHPHNLYLEWLSETGLVGFGLFATCMGLLVIRWLHAWPNLKTNPVYLGLLITLSLRFFPFAPLTSFFISWFAIPLWLFIGWLNALSAEALQEKSE